MGKLRLSDKERGWVEVLVKVKAHQLSQCAAAEVLGVSYRHFKRKSARFLDEGAAGVAQGLRSQRSNHRVDPKRRARVLKL